MLKRCSPRSRTSAVSGNGSASSSTAPFFPVKNAASSCSVPRAIVPSTSGRAVDSFLKNMLARSGWAVGPLCMSCRQPAAATTRRHAAPSLIETAIAPRPSRLALRLNFIDLTRIEPFEKVVRRGAIELWIRRLHQEKELVAAGALEARHVEHRVIRHRQAVQDDHAEHAGNGGEQDRHLERHRDELRPAGER